jgi:hypothetical protein
MDGVIGGAPPELHRGKSPRGLDKRGLFAQFQRNLTRKIQT